MISIEMQSIRDEFSRWLDVVAHAETVRVCDAGKPVLEIRPVDLIATKFSALAHAWTSQRGPVSSISRLSMHPAYQQIIGMGEAVVPLILRESEQRPDHWFWALNAITGANPVPKASEGVLNEMAAAWLNWGTAHGYR